MWFWRGQQKSGKKFWKRVSQRGPFCTYVVDVPAWEALCSGSRWLVAEVGQLEIAVQTFGERLQQLRERGGLTQERLAEASGVNVWTIRNYEQGRHEPNLKVAIDLARAIGATVEAFADCSEQPLPKRARGRPPKHVMTK
jgi:DNA-binding XRE family transcriptional regulator